MTDREEILMVQREPMFFAELKGDGWHIYKRTEEQGLEVARTRHRRWKDRIVESLNEQGILRAEIDRLEWLPQPNPEEDHDE